MFFQMKNHMTLQRKTRQCVSSLLFSEAHVWHVTAPHIFESDQFRFTQYQHTLSRHCMGGM